MQINKAITCHKGRTDKYKVWHQWPHTVPKIKDCEWVSVTAFNSMGHKVLKIAQLSNDPKKQSTVTNWNAAHLGEDTVFCLTVRITAAFIVQVIVIDFQKLSIFQLRH